MSAPVQPERLWRRLKRAGLGSRRSVCELIGSGAVLVDGQAAAPLACVTDDSVITVHGEPLGSPAHLQYWVLNKPEGIDCCVQPERPHSIAKLLEVLPAGLFPVGRLDKDSCGLLLLTNDGKLCQRLMHPDFWHEKEYDVAVDKDLTALHLQQLRSGISYQVGPHRYQPRPCLVTQAAPRRLQITLTEGMNRQIRYMCREVGLRVLKLQRIRLNQLLLGDLAPGAVRELSPPEVTRLQQTTAAHSPPRPSA